MTLCDASPLIALINQSDQNHARCVAALPALSSPLLTTWACFTEAMYLLGRYGGWLAQSELWGHHGWDSCDSRESISGYTVF